MEDYATPVPLDVFADSRARFESLVAMLSGAEAGASTHGDLEERLRTDGMELLRGLFQDHLRLRALQERRVDAVAGCDGVVRTRAERGRTRALATVFGEVEVERIVYRAPGAPGLHPADMALSLPREKHSHGLRKRAAVEAVRGSFDDARDAIARSCGSVPGKRQVEELVGRAAVDVDDFYRHHRPQPAEPAALLVLTFDAKGIVMLPAHLREATRRNAAKKDAAGGQRLASRLSSGEKRGRKRMAEVAAVYDAHPVPRTPLDVVAATVLDREDKLRGPVAGGKWVTASVRDSCKEVVAAVFDEATRRDPGRARTWVVLVDGARYQLDLIRAEAARREVAVHIVCDIVHVLEYVSAPRGALSYPPHSGERLEGISLGLMAYLDPKGKGDRSMPENRWPFQTVGAGHRGASAIWRKLDCLKPNLQKVQFVHPPESRPKPASNPAMRSRSARCNLRGRSDVQSGH